MVQAKDFRILSLQLSVFTPELLFNPNKILGNVMSKFSDNFDGDTTVIPIPSNAPKEIPRLILASSDKRIRLEISEERVNFFRYRDKNDTLIDKNSFFELCSDVYKEYMKFTFAKVGRLALIRNNFLKNENPGLTLVQNFCKESLFEEPFNRPSNFEIHSHKEYKFDEFNVNSWVRCKSAAFQADNVPIILVEQDINTIASKTKEGYEFSIEEIIKFINLATSEQELILVKYFPEQ